MRQRDLQRLHATICQVVDRIEQAGEEDSLVFAVIRKDHRELHPIRSPGGIGIGALVNAEARRDFF